MMAVDFCMGPSFSCKSQVVGRLAEIDRWISEGPQGREGVWFGFLVYWMPPESATMVLPPKREGPYAPTAGPQYRAGSAEDMLVACAFASCATH